MSQNLTCSFPQAAPTRVRACRGRANIVGWRMTALLDIEMLSHREIPYIRAENAVQLKNTLAQGRDRHETGAVAVTATLIVEGSCSSPHVGFRHSMCQADASGRRYATHGAH